MAEAAQYPTSLTTQLYEVVARKSTTLTADVDTLNTTIPVASTSGFPSQGFISINNETLYYSSTDTTNFYVSRAYAGIAASHDEGNDVKLVVAAASINRMRLEIYAIQDYIGKSGDTRTTTLYYKLHNLWSITQGGSTQVTNLNAQYVGGKTTIDEDDMASDLDTAVPTQQSVKAYVDDTIKSGDNLLLNPEFQDSNGDGLPDYWTLYLTPTLAIAADTLFPALKGNQWTITTSGAAWQGWRLAGGTANWLKVKPSTTYTFSIDYKLAEAGKSFSLVIKSYNGAAEAETHLNATVFTSATATRYSFTFTTHSTADNLFIESIGSSNTVSHIITYSHPKLEEGSVATPYQPPSRERKYISAITSSATPTPIIQARNNMFIITALAAAAEFAAPTYAGYPAPIDGDSLLIRVKDDGTARALTYNAIFTETYSSALPDTTTANKTLILFFIYNSVSADWELLYTDEEA
jgi:hypothetical protein